MNAARIVSPRIKNLRRCSRCKTRAKVPIETLLSRDGKLIKPAGLVKKLAMPSSGLRSHAMLDVQTRAARLSITRAFIVTRVRAFSCGHLIDHHVLPEINFAALS